MSKLKELLNKTSKMLYAIIVLSAIGLTITYGVFIVESNKYKASKTVSDSYIIKEDRSSSLVAVMVEQTAGSGNYQEASTIPAGYTLNTTESYCTVNGVRDNTISLSYRGTALTINPMQTKGTKCYLYFDAVDTSNITSVMAAASLGERGNNFSAPFSEDGTTLNYTAGVYETNNTDDGSTVYYYSGILQNNWVRFGNNGSGTCYYWRVMRTNTAIEGGGVRLLYAGSSTSCSGAVPNMTGAYVATGTYTSYSANSKSSSVGYMYTSGQQHGHGTSSNAKTQLEKWYTSSKLSNFSSKINENAVYCNDRSVPSGTTWTDSGSTDYSYSAHKRTAPTFICTNNGDKFSKGTSGSGNGYLTYPIALPSYDEYWFAGAKGAKDSYSWFSITSSGSNLYSSSSVYHTMTPSNYTSSPNSSNSKGRIYDIKITDSSYFRANPNCTNCGTGLLRPVISLKSTVSYSGSGTVADPWVVN